jgi:hypothetical protein
MLPVCSNVSFVIAAAASGLNVAATSLLKRHFCPLHKPLKQTKSSPANKYERDIPGVHLCRALTSTEVVALFFFTEKTNK